MLREIKYGVRPSYHRGDRMNDGRSSTYYYFTYASMNKRTTIITITHTAWAPHPPNERARVRPACTLGGSYGASNRPVAPGATDDAEFRCSTTTSRVRRVDAQSVVVVSSIIYILIYGREHRSRRVGRRIAARPVAFAGGGAIH